MYIQQPTGDLPFSLPKGYSGNAFEVAPRPTPPEAEPIAPTSVTPAPDEPPEGGTAEAFAPAQKQGREGGIFERLPFLSSLLPPPRKRHGEKRGLPDWTILGIILLLLLDSPENDLLPFVLILLLWD